MVDLKITDNILNTECRKIYKNTINMEKMNEIDSLVLAWIRIKLCKLHGLFSPGYLEPLHLLVDMIL